MQWTNLPRLHLPLAFIKLFSTQQPVILLNYGRSHHLSAQYSAINNPVLRAKARVSRITSRNKARWPHSPFPEFTAQILLLLLSSPPPQPHCPLCVPRHREGIFLRILRLLAVSVCKVLSLNNYTGSSFTWFDIAHFLYTLQCLPYHI